MPDPSFQNSEELDDIKSEFDIIQSEWSETLEDLQSAKEELTEKDLFATIDYLTFCDNLFKNIYIDITEIDSYRENVQELKEKSGSYKKALEELEKIDEKLYQLRTEMQETMLAVGEEYPVLADETLREAQDRIAEYAEEMDREKTTPSIKTENPEGLEKGLFLQELKDSLEYYREAREEFISEVEMNKLENLPEGQIPEDLGEEMPEIDSVLSQLDTTITACDLAIINSEDSV